MLRFSIGSFMCTQTPLSSVAPRMVVELGDESEFEVDVERPESSPLVYGDTLTAEVVAKYLHGAPMVGAEVAYTLNRTDSGFTPPGELNRDFQFGSQPEYARWGWWTPPSRMVTSGTGKTTAAGKLAVEHVVAAIDPAPREGELLVGNGGG